MPKAKINGININYEVHGHGEETLVLIIGGIAPQRVWIFQTCEFKKHYRVITFDNRGFGGSDKPGGCGAYTMKIMADDVVGLMNHLDIEKAHVLGQSLGGMIAQVLAINYPCRINKLILASTFAGRNIPPDLLEALGYEKGDEPSGIAQEFSKAMGYPKGFTDEDARREPMLKIVLTLTSCAFNTRPFRIAFRIAGKLIKLCVKFYYQFFMETTGLPGQEEALLAHNTLKDLPKIQVPTLVITGDNDRIINPSSSDMIAKLIPHATLVKVKDGSHAFFVEKRGEFNKIVLDFLRA